MASVLKVDELKGNSTAGIIEVTGEGNSTTTNLQQGLVKAWAETSANGETLRDSFNISGLLDTAEGIQTCNYQNPFSSGNYVCVTTGDTVGNDRVYSATNASNWIVYSFDGAYDDIGQGTMAAGDLA